LPPLAAQSYFLKRSPGRSATAPSWPGCSTTSELATL